MALHFESTPSKLRLGGRSDVFARGGVRSGATEAASEPPSEVFGTGTKKG